MSGEPIVMNDMIQAYPQCSICGCGLGLHFMPRQALMQRHLCETCQRFEKWLEPLAQKIAEKVVEAMKDAR